MKLIKLQYKFILVNDEEIKSKSYEWVFHRDSNSIFRYDLDEIANNTYQKIISENPDFSLLSEEDCKTIGFSNFDAYTFIKDEFGFTDELLQNWEKSLSSNKLADFGNILNLVENSFKTAQSLNDKMFSLDDMKQCFLYAREFNSIDGIVYINVVLNFTNNNSDLQAVHVNFEDYIQSLQKTEWEVEVEMECSEIRQCECIDNSHCLKVQPKITNNSIKVIKIL